MVGFIIKFITMHGHLNVKLKWALQNMRVCIRFIWPHPAQDTNNCPAVVNMITKLRIP